MSTRGIPAPSAGGVDGSEYRRELFLANSARARGHQLLADPFMPELPSTMVVVALQAESAGVFEAAGIPVLYCGVGKVNAELALARVLTRYTLQGQAMPLVLNFGSA